MPPVDPKEFAKLVAAELEKTRCADNPQNACQVFDPETILGIKAAVKTFNSIRSFAWWAGAIVGGTILTAFASGVAWVLWEGFKVAVKTKAG